MICRLLLNVVSRLVGSSNWGRVCLWTQINISLLLYNGFVCVCVWEWVFISCVWVHLDLYVQGLNSMCMCVCLQFHQCRVAASKILCASVNFFSALVWVCAQVWMQCMFAIISFSGQRLSLCPFWLITTAVHVPSLDLGTAYSTGHMSPVCFPWATCVRCK